MQKLIQKIKSVELAARLRIQSTALKAIHDYLYLAGVIQIVPVMLSPITDPLCHSVFDADIQYCGQRLALTKSMIMHKQISLMSPHIDKVYVVSPNIRLEKAAGLADTKRHLIDFSQVDIEFKGTGRGEFMSFIEEMMEHTLKRIIEECGAELELLDRKLSAPSGPFGVFDSVDALEEYGKDYDSILSREATGLFWITNLKREFYDREDPDCPGRHLNYDLTYPEGFGEALSGGEREWEHDVIVRKIRERGQSTSSFAPYLELARRGELKPSAGGGLGVERLVRYVTGAADIGDVTPFAKKPGVKVIL
ncbi:MAG: asparagine synthetase A [Candidatus Micrarchaeota archaeon]